MSDVRGRTRFLTFSAEFDVVRRMLREREEPVMKLYELRALYCEVLIFIFISWCRPSSRSIGGSDFVSRSRRVQVRSEGRWLCVASPPSLPPPPPPQREKALAAGRVARIVNRTPAWLVESGEWRRRRSYPSSSSNEAARFLGGLKSVTDYFDQFINPSGDRDGLSEFVFRSKYFYTLNSRHSKTDSGGRG